MSNFKKTFLDHYLKLGLGSLPKSDIDALVMHLLDQYGINESEPLAALNNQKVSELLRTTPSRVKKLRYDAALKFGANIEDQAKGKLLAALSKASIELKDKKICIIIEDSLAKNWLQGQLKTHQQLFDGSFNRELIEVDSKGFFKVLKLCFSKPLTNKFESEFNKLAQKQFTEETLKVFRELAFNFAKAAVTAVGAGAVGVFNASVRDS